MEKIGNAPVFPKWECKVERLDDDGDKNVFECVFKTRLRKFDEEIGKWYYWDFYRQYKSNIEFSREHIQQLTEYLIHEVYLTIICGKIQHELKTPDRLGLFPECETQETELERFEKIIQQEYKKEKE